VHLQVVDKGVGQVRVLLPMNVFFVALVVAFCRCWSGSSTNASASKAISSIIYTRLIFVFFSYHLVISMLPPQTALLSSLSTSKHRLRYNLSHLRPQFQCEHSNSHHSNIRLKLNRYFNFSALAMFADCPTRSSITCSTMSGLA
jgi:hypothetical protein